MPGRNHARTGSVRLAAPTGLVLLLACVPARAFGSAQELYGVAPKDMALAQAATALGDHYGAVYYDPAGMAAATRIRFYAYYMGADSQLKIDGKEASGVDPLQATSVGAVIPLPLKGKLDGRIALGLLLHSPVDRLIRVYSRPATDPQFILLQNHGQILGFFVGGSYRISNSLAVGAGTRLAANVHADVTLVTTDRGTEQETSGFLSTTATPLFAFRWAPPAGHWAAALVYRHRFKQVFATPSSNDLGGVRAPTPGLKATTQFVPTEIVAGGAWTSGPAWTATADLAYKKWSEFPDPTVVLGRIPPGTAPFPAFHDTIAPRLGLERRLAVAGNWTVALRGGYGYEPSPVPDMKDDYNFFDNDRHLFGLGAGVAMPWHEGRMRLDAGMQYQLLSSRTETKDPAKVPAGTVMSHTTSGNILAGSLGVSWEY